MMLKVNSSDSVNVISQVSPTSPGFRSINELNSLWAQLANIPVTEDGTALDEDFMHFEKGAHVDDVWQWFEEMNPSFSVAAQLYSSDPH
ncbi:hypothetical protein ACI2KR_06635 [Pseudomonas luteola]